MTERILNLKKMQNPFFGVFLFFAFVFIASLPSKISSFNLSSLTVAWSPDYAIQVIYRPTREGRLVQLCVGLYYLIDHL